MRKIVAQGEVERIPQAEVESAGKLKTWSQEKKAKLKQKKENIKIKCGFAG